MALVSGSSLGIDCSTKRRGLPASLKLLRAGRQKRLHQVSSQKPTVQVSGLFAATLSSAGRVFFFPLVLRSTGEVIQRLALSQRTPSRSKVARTVSPLTRSFVKPSSKLTSAAISNVHRLLCLPNFRGSW